MKIAGFPVKQYHERTGFILAGFRVFLSMHGLKSLIYRLNDYNNFNHLNNLKGFLMSRIIAVVNQKGGPGKTTVTMNLAGALSKNYSVMVADTDPQGSALRWSASAEDESPFPAVVSGLSQAGGKTHRELQKVYGNYDFILVDCPPAIDSPVPQSVLLVADMALLPVIPSPVDLWAAQGIVQLIERVQGINEKLISRLIINQAENTNLSGEVIEILGGFGIPVLNSQLRRRTAYREAALYGSSVHDLGSKAKPAMEEVEALKAELLKVLEV